jgi:hypothetical protein
MLTMALSGSEVHRPWAGPFLKDPGPHILTLGPEISTGGEEGVLQATPKLHPPYRPGPGAGSQDSQVEGPEGWRARLKPVDRKGPVDR